MGAKIYGYGRSEKKNLKCFEGYYTKPQLQEFLTKIDYLINVMPSTKETQGLLNGGLFENCQGNNEH